MQRREPANGLNPVQRQERAQVLDPQQRLQLYRGLERYRIRL